MRKINDGLTNHQRWYRRHRDEIRADPRPKEYHREWTKAHPWKSKEYQERWIAKDPEHYREWRRGYQRNWQAENRDKTSGYYRKYHQTHHEEIQAKRREKRMAEKDNPNRYSRARHDKLRHEVFTKLGGKCVACGVSDYRVLQLNHINGGGHRQREERKLVGDKLLLAILKGTIDNALFDVRCANCNMLHARENGLLNRGKGNKVFA